MHPHQAAPAIYHCSPWRHTSSCHLKLIAPECIPLGDTSDPTASDEDVASWISWFCSLKGNEFFCEVEDEFISDDFNLSGLSSQAFSLRQGYND